MADEASIRASYPLHGFVICCTSVEMDERVQIQTQCGRMGAEHVLDLTSEVTHLICGELFSPKYRYVAKNREDVKVMSTKWINAIYKAWIAGDDIDTSYFEKKYRFPILYGLNISVTGIPDVFERERISEICQSESATYSPDLTGDVNILIAAAPTGKKYQFARQRNIKVVVPQWLSDSMERGMALDESLYDPRLPPDQIGKNAKPTKSVQAEVIAGAGKRKVRKSTQDKLGGQSQSLWDDIMGQAVSAKPAKQDEWADTKNASMDVEEDAVPEKRRGSSDAQRLQSGEVTPHSPTKKRKSGGMFVNTCFWMWGFDTGQMAALKAAIMPHDGTIVASLEELAATTEFSWKMVVVPRAKVIKECPVIPEDTTMVTEWWLESCLIHQKFVTPTGDFTTMPIEKFEIPEMKGMNISITRFQGVDLLYYPRLIKLLGATFQEIMHKKCKLLITENTHSTESDKITFAHQQNIPVVTGEWLVECLKQNQKLPYEAYRVFPPGGKQLLEDMFRVEKRKAEADLRPESPKKPSTNVPTKKLPGLPNPLPSNAFAGSIFSGNAKFLKGKAFYFPETLNDHDEMVGFVKRSGAQVLEDLDKLAITHFVCSKDFYDTQHPNKELQRDRGSQNCVIVSPEWLYKMKTAGKLLAEDDFIWTPESTEENPTKKNPREEDPPEDNPPEEKESSLILPEPLPETHLMPPPRRRSGTLTTTETTVSVEEMSDRAGGTVLSATETTTTTTHVITVDPNLAAMFTTSPNSSFTPLTSGSGEPVPEANVTSSNLSEISTMLSKFPKSQLAAAIAAPAPRGQRKLQGRATGARQRVFSRTPSGASMSSDSQPPPVITTSGLSSLSTISGSQDMADEMEKQAAKDAETQASQALRYNHEEIAMEKREMRKRLDKNAVVETPARTTRAAPKRGKAAESQHTPARRSARKKD
ncbi:hypothetical protein BZA77DRAFT_314276 [Pyronema omphalodes]|nr:hypothetical protein BZA77DRAFT_314276 [Pyronema omphalodes]